MFSTTTSSESSTPSTAKQQQDAAFTVGQKDIGLENSDTNQNTVKMNNDGEISWRSLIEKSIAKSRNVRGGNYVQLATVDATTMEARCRTVVFRGFLNLPPGHAQRRTLDDMSCVMKMITHRRSTKVAEIMQNPKAEIVWWFSQSNEQYRIRGQLVLIGNDGLVEAEPVDPVLAQARREQWGNLRDGAREEYFRVPTPGESFEIETQPVPTGGRDEVTGKLLPLPDDFLLMLLVPNRVDYLRLTNMYRQIEELTTSKEDGKWILQRVNP